MKSIVAMYKDCKEGVLQNFAQLIIRAGGLAEDKGPLKLVLTIWMTIHHIQTEQTVEVSGYTGTSN